MSGINIEELIFLTVLYQITYLLKHYQLNFVTFQYKSNSIIPNNLSTETELYYLYGRHNRSNSIIPNNLSTETAVDISLMTQLELTVLYQITYLLKP